MTEYRFIVEIPGNPSDKLAVILPNGAMAEYNPMAGWRAKKEPSTITFPVTEIGTYYFTLEQKDIQRNITSDSMPYGNFGLVPLNSFDLSNDVPEIRGIGFDSRERLWIWTGTHMIPFKTQYDGYLFDSAERALYLTQPYSEVQVL
jgi:hypothetical protein